MGLGPLTGFFFLNPQFPTESGSSPLEFITAERCTIREVTGSGMVYKTGISRTWRGGGDGNQTECQCISPLQHQFLVSGGMRFEGML